jgi:hypothetical protein
MSFAPITEEFDELFARTLPPAAKTLWSWLRRQAPSGKVMEFDLTDFVQKFNYSLKWGRRALDCLIDNGLVKIVRKFHGYGFRVIVYQIGELRNGKKTSSESEETSNDWNKTSQILPSNPHSFVNNKKESIDNKLKTQTLPTHHPVLIDNEVAETPYQHTQISQDSEQQDLLRQAENLGIHLNNNLIALALNHSVEVVRNAIAALREQLSAGKKVANPAGYLTNAIRRGWKPNAQRHSPRTTENPIVVQSQQQSSAIVIDSEGGSMTLPAPVSQLLPSVPLPIVDDFADTFVSIQLNIRRLSWTLEIIEQTLQERYQVSKRRLLSNEQLLDWAAFLGSCER